jgi:CheY-like chemotaxis protein
MTSRPASGTRHRRPGRVLIVGDDALALGAMARVLSSKHEVVMASSAIEALERLEAGERYDVVLCDLMMPVMDGIELHRRLASSLPSEAERIVFFTGEVVIARVEEFFRKVNNLLLLRPVDVEGLRALIERRRRYRERDQHSQVG